MATVLHINSSVRNGASVTRQLGGEFIAKWEQSHPSDVVVTRDLAAAPLPHMSEQMVGAYFTAPEQRNAEQAHAIKLSDTLVDELLAADTVVIGAPMYNFSVPSGLKAWIDHVARVGRTFKYGANGPEGLVTGKKVYVVVASGGVYTEGPAAAYDHVASYLRAVLGFLGMTDVTFIFAEGVSKGEEAVTAAIAKARAGIDAVAA